MKKLLLSLVAIVLMGNVNAQIERMPLGEFPSFDSHEAYGWWPDGWDFEGTWTIPGKGGAGVTANGSKRVQFEGAAGKDLIDGGVKEYLRDVYCKVQLGTGTYSLKINAFIDEYEPIESNSPFSYILSDSEGKVVHQMYVRATGLGDLVYADYEPQEIILDNGTYRFSIQALLTETTEFCQAYTKSISLMQIDGDAYDPDSDTSSKINLTNSANCRISMDDTRIFVKAEELIQSVNIINAQGSVVCQVGKIGESSIEMPKPMNAGVYFIIVRTISMATKVQKIVVL